MSYAQTCSWDMVFRFIYIYIYVPVHRYVSSIEGSRYFLHTDMLVGSDYSFVSIDVAHSKKSCISYGLHFSYGTGSGTGNGTGDCSGNGTGNGTGDGSGDVSRGMVRGMARVMFRGMVHGMVQGMVRGMVQPKYCTVLSNTEQYCTTLFNERCTFLYLFVYDCIVMHYCIVVLLYYGRTVLLRCYCRGPKKICAAVLLL